MKKIVVTGGLGFIGSHVVRKLIEKKYYVRILDNQSKNIIQSVNKSDSLRAATQNLVRNDKHCEILNIDLTDTKKTEVAFSGADICINLAAKIGGIGYFHKYPANILSENNKIYSSTFEASVKNKLERMIYISSSMVFESTKKFPSSESDILKIPPPISAYGFSKLIGEEYCHAFWEQYKLPFSICRPFNAYGKNEFPNEEIGYAHVIPDLIKKIIDEQYPLELLGNGKQIRCFTHVEDLADGIIAVMENRNAVNEDFNLADPRPIKMYNLAKLIWKLSGQKKKFKIKLVKSFKYDIQKRIPDVSKAEKYLGWKTKIPFEDGLRETIQWLQRQ